MVLDNEQLPSGFVQELSCDCLAPCLRFSLDSGASCVQVAAGLLLWRGPEPLDALPPPQPPPAKADAGAGASPTAATPPHPAAAPAERSGDAAVIGTAAPEESVCGAAAPVASRLQQSPARQRETVQQQKGVRQQEADGQQEAAAKQFRRDFRRRRRRGAGAAVPAFVAALVLGCCALALLSDLALRQFTGHRCGGSLR